MAFDFERYLKVCEPDNVELYTKQSSETPFYTSNDEIPATTNDVSISSVPKTQEPRRTTGIDAHLSPLLNRIPNTRHSLGETVKGLEEIECRFRFSENIGETRIGVKTGLFKQNSLPVSFDTYHRSRDKTETGRRRRNSVRFADEVGEALTTFLMIPSRFEDNEPDKEGIDAIQKTRAKVKGGYKFANKNYNDTSKIRLPDSIELLSAGTEALKTKSSNSTPTFQLCFDQPAANYEDFRRRLFLQFVCLENVKIDVSSHEDGTRNVFVNHGTVLCTIKVRNIHPIKRVFARCTDNNWKTYADISSVYVNDGTMSLNEYDTFALALQNPFRLNGTASSDHGTASSDSVADSYCRKTAAVEFALCYEVLGSEYWDNNEGQNYRIVWLTGYHTID